MFKYAFLLGILISFAADAAISAPLSGESSGTNSASVAPVPSVVLPTAVPSPARPLLGVIEYFSGRSGGDEFANYKYYFKQELQDDMARKRFRQSPFESRAFQFTIDKQKFLSTCALADLGEIDTNRRCLLVAFHYNIPVTQTTIIPVRYGYARFNSKLTSVSARGSSWIEEPVKVLSITPQNDVLKVNRSDRTDIQLEMKPEWMGASGGRAYYEKEITDVYDYNLPKVIGTTSRFGDVAWTYYPAKAQNIIYGEQTAYAIISIPSDAQSIHLLCDLSYQLKLFKYAPGPKQRVFDTVTLAAEVGNVPNWTNFKRAHFTDLPEGLVKSIDNVILDRRSYSVVHGNTDSQGTLVIDAQAGKLFKLDNFRLVQVQ